MAHHRLGSQRDDLCGLRNGIAGTWLVPASQTPDAASNTGVLPMDAVYEILLRLSAKELCRLRTVCRLWRSLLSDRMFATAHAARHHGPPLIVAHYATKNSTLFDIMDLSGRVIKRVRRTTLHDEQVMSTQLELVRYGRATDMIRLLTPDTGAVHALPDGLAEQHEVHGLNISHYSTMVASGMVPSTGEYKVLRMLDSYPDNHPGQLCEVYTLDHDRSRWRGKKAPPHTVTFGNWSSVVINGIVYFLSDEFVHGEDAGPDRIASFDLEEEEWRSSIRGPLSSLSDDDADENYMDWYDYSLATLSGCLVLVHRTPDPSMDLWFLVDIEKGLWVKKHSIQLSVQDVKSMIHPLLVLHDEKILHCCTMGDKGFLRIYNPRTKTFTDVAEIEHFVIAGLYTGNLLSLATCASIVS